jgi:hypothetical protein
MDPGDRYRSRQQLAEAPSVHHAPPVAISPQAESLWNIRRPMNEDRQQKRGCPFEEAAPHSKAFT